MDTICKKYEAWIAYYVGDGSYDAGYDKKNPEFCTKYGMYQYTSAHYVNGKGPYDANVAYKDYPSIVKKYGFNGYAADSPPDGCLDEVTGGDGFVKVRGWAFDGDDISKNIEVHVYIGGGPGEAGAEGHIIKADTYRPDVHNVHNCGDYHGFESNVGTALTGNQPVYVYAISSSGAGENTLLGSQTVNIKSDTQKPKASNVRVVSSDLESFTLACDVTDNSGFKSVTFPTWTKDNPGNVKWFEGSVENGVATCRIPIKEFDDYQGVYFTDVYAKDYAGYEASVIGFKTSFYLPEACVDNVLDAKGAIRVNGWAFDRDNLKEGLEIHLYIGAPAGDPNAELYKIKADKLRRDVNKVLGCGEYHGFDEVIYPTLKGEQPVYIYILNTGNGGNVFKEMKTVNISSSTTLKGDADRSGKVDISDVTLIRKNLAEPALEKGYDAISDINGNGRIDIRDATYIQLYLARYIKNLNVKK